MSDVSLEPCGMIPAPAQLHFCGSRVPGTAASLLVQVSLSPAVRLPDVASALQVSLWDKVLLCHRSPFPTHPRII